MPLQSLIRSLDQARQQTLALVADLDDSQITEQPDGVDNHPAWTLGHLFLLDAYVADVLKAEDAPSLDERWAAVYGRESVPRADTSAYLTKREYLERLDTVQAVVYGTLASLDATDLDAPLPRPLPFGNVSTHVDLILHLLWHEGYHAGQLTAWRRAMGLPAAPAR